LTQSLGKEKEKLIKAKRIAKKLQYQCKIYRRYQAMINNQRPLPLLSAGKKNTLTSSTSELDLESADPFTLLSLAFSVCQTNPMTTEDLLSRDKSKPFAQQIATLIKSKNPHFMVNKDAIALRTRTTLQDILSHPVSTELFKDYMCLTHNEDVVLCYLTLKYFENTENNSPEQKLLCPLIIERFIENGSVYEANVMSEMKCKVIHAANTGDINNKMFRPICTEVFRLMQTNNWDGFRNSSSFITCLTVLDMSAATQKFIDCDVNGSEQEA
jgi:hypothetical protein